MTILNVWVERHRALVAVDTRCDVEAVPAADLDRLGARPGMHFCKMAPLVHVGGLLAVQGTAMMLGGVFTLVQQQQYIGFDDIDAALPRLLPLA